jgi:hypothetical protein
MKTLESTTVDCAVLAHNFDMALNAYNDALQSVNATYSTHLSVCESIRKAGFTTVQSGHSKAKSPKKREFPYLVLTNEIKANYKGDVKGMDGTIKQKVATLSFYLETGRFTSNVGKDKLRIVWEVESAEHEKLKAKEAKALQETKAAAAIAVKSRLDAVNMQAAAKLASEQKEPDALIKQITEEQRRLEKEAEEDATNSKAAADILAKLKKAAADKAADVAKAKAALDAKNAKAKKTVTPSASTTTTGAPDHSASVDKISLQAGISADQAAQVDASIAIMEKRFSTAQFIYLRKRLDIVLDGLTE